MKLMKQGMAILFVLGCATAALAQDSKPDVAKTLDGYVYRVEKEFAGAADAMPEDKYSFAPTNGEFKGVRTFGEQVKHVATVNYVFGAGILGEKPPIEVNEEKGPDSVKSKADIMKFLNDSFAYLHNALATVNGENLVTPMQWGKNSTTRFQIVLMAAGHPFDHYGQMVEYLRMNGIVPPASRH
jgi:uncharacterized damage-inducible protein DinB